ncbi:MAG: TIGR01244 family phosphatase [Parvularculaceae bacterium]|jgi:uncharacterized protein (TIGR01244 family)|nr:TIGR01244 family phosphatase [Parvularculaceae bacterium]
MIELAPGFLVSPQIRPTDIATAKAAGVTLVINNRPDGEDPLQPKGADIADAARGAGIAYVAIPIGAAGVSDTDIDAFEAAMSKNKGKTLAFCRTGTRSTVLRALARARSGVEPDALIEEAAAAGYNIAGLAPRLIALSQSAR